MPETFTQYLEKWLKLATTQGLNNPLVKMPVKRFRLLQPDEFKAIVNGRSLKISTISDPIVRQLYKNFQTYIRERGEHCAYICFGSVEDIIAAGVGQQPKLALFPVCLRRVKLDTIGEHVKVSVEDNEPWKFNPVLRAHLKKLGIIVKNNLLEEPDKTFQWLKAQIGNRASLNNDCYIGLFSSQQLVVQERLSEGPLRLALAKNQVIQAKITGEKIKAPAEEVTDDGIEELGLVLPCDDSQLRVVQLTDHGFSIQVEGPPGTGKSQTIANIISNALYHGRKVLLVCDKKAAIIQVEKRLCECGLKPALLNLHDEDLDKHEFLKQAIDTFQDCGEPKTYPFEELLEIRQILNERVKFGRKIAHPSLQVTNHNALAGMIRLRKELKSVPNIKIPNWRSLSRDRLKKILDGLNQWPNFSKVINDNLNVWNRVRVEAFEQNPNIVKELESLVQSIFKQFESFDDIKELAASIGITMPFNSDEDVKRALEFATIVTKKPLCYPMLIDNRQITLDELKNLRQLWNSREKLINARHPVPLEFIYPQDVEEEAKELLKVENAKTWQDLHDRKAYYQTTFNKINEHQKNYRNLCDQIGLVYSPLLKERRAQLKVVIDLYTDGETIPRYWWFPNISPVLTIKEWKATLKACIDVAKRAQFPLHFIAFENISATHLKHIAAMAEHGFNLVSYCLNYVDDRKCKYALRQIFPTIPTRRFKDWHGLTLLVEEARTMLNKLRNIADIHTNLKQLTSEYIAIAHENHDNGENYLADEKIKKLENVAANVEKIKQDWKGLFDIGSIQWQSFWDFKSHNSQVIRSAQSLFEELDNLVLPDGLGSDNIEEALKHYDSSLQRIDKFLSDYEKIDGDRANLVLESLNAQKKFKQYNQDLGLLDKYLQLQTDNKTQPDWEWLNNVITWRDLFERLRGQQKLDIDSKLWTEICKKLEEHLAFMGSAYEKLNGIFKDPLTDVADYSSFKTRLNEILKALEDKDLWLEKCRWQGKISAYPEIIDLWSKALDNSVPAENCQRLFCFNLLRLSDPITKPNGTDLKQILNNFIKLDEKLDSWLLDHLKAKLSKSMKEAASAAARSESELRRLSSLQRVRGTVRELVNAHFDYLIAAKPCWMMSPTSLANLIDSNIFEKYGVPFDLVIFDEASQIRVPDGLLSMAFGKQVVIVGDKNQLPPTNFFASFADPDSDTEENDFGTSESLLHEFCGVFEPNTTQVMLMSHYRSETPDLIRFSNDWFYNSKLEIYPPAHISGIGRRLHYVPDGVYSEKPGQRTNYVEAREVVNLIEKHVQEFPNKSLGVVTMNIPQMELIDSLIQKMPSKVQNFCNDESKFFLRNLETVQGDEMDHIILSLTYGKNSSGRFNASILGPLIKNGGERRLNVAITRSRSGLIVVSSLRSSDLEETTAQSKGFECLKSFLKDLESSERERNYGISSKRFEPLNDGISNVVFCESPFEEQVVEFLENAGYEVECQYGAGHFRIDIVVKEQGKNLLAIECDGASYHRSRVARTRDRARQRLLEKLGWRFHRVWSTNWWFYEEQEKEAILDAIASARQALKTNNSKVNYSRLFI